ncbi:hypothetical protein MRBLMR1_002570 [Neorhizobium sp. LMR1-1-1.1]
MLLGASLPSDFALIEWQVVTEIAVQNPPGQRLSLVASRRCVNVSYFLAPAPN